MQSHSSWFISIHRLKERLDEVDVLLNKYKTASTNLSPCKRLRELEKELSGLTPSEDKKALQPAEERTVEDPDLTKQVYARNVMTDGAIGMRLV